MTLNLEHFRAKLNSEKKHLEGELGTIAHKDGDPSEGGESGWEAKSTNVDESIEADANEVADKIEEYETNRAITDDLQKGLRDVDDALAKIEQGTYGKCEVGREDIEEDRLNANPAARTCKLHMNEVLP